MSQPDPCLSVFIRVPDRKRDERSFLFHLRRAELARRPLLRCVRIAPAQPGRRNLPSLRRDGAAR